MPLYEYECTRCSHRFERIERVAGPHTKKCPQCGGKVERLLAPSAFQFKGSGWYVTDYARKGAPASDSPGGDSEKAEKTAKEGKEAASAKESKKGKKGSESS